MTASALGFMSLFAQGSNGFGFRSDWPAREPFSPIPQWGGLIDARAIDTTDSNSKSVGPECPRQDSNLRPTA